MVRSGFLASLYFISLLLQDNKSPAANQNSGTACSWRAQGQRKCHCLDGADCKGCTTRCTCNSGCLAGYRGSHCQTLCPLAWYGVNCSWSCSHCSGRSRCNPVTGHCPSGCLPNWTGPFCNISAAGGQTVSTPCDDKLTTSACQADGCPPVFPTCHSAGRNTSKPLACSCGSCLGGPRLCDVTIGVCLLGCLAGFTGKACTVQVCPRGSYGPQCSHRCKSVCPCGCHPVSGQCQSCPDKNYRTQFAVTSSQSYRIEHQHDVAGDQETGGQKWSWHVLAFVPVMAIAFVFHAAYLQSKRSRQQHVQEVFRRLTSDRSFRFVRHPSLLTRVRRAMLDVCVLSAESHAAALKELDRVLGTNESYEIFFMSDRYRQYRLYLTNKIWAAMNSSTTDSVTEDSQSLVPRLVSKAMGSIKRSSTGTQPQQQPKTQPRRQEAGEDLDTHHHGHHGVLEDDPDSEDPHEGPRPSVRFSSATSMVILTPSSSSGSTQSWDRSSETRQASVKQVCVNQAPAATDGVSLEEVQHGDLPSQPSPSPPNTSFSFFDEWNSRFLAFANLNSSSSRSASSAFVDLRCDGPEDEV